jgi:hypothetical protein
MLDDVWALCHYSLKATSFAGIFVDGDRERIPYEADAYIAQLGDYACNPEYTLARHTAEYLMAHATWPAEWQMHMPLVAWADYLYSGDPDFLSRYYSELGAKTLVSLERGDGLIADPAGHATPDLLARLHLPDHQPPPLKHLIPQEVLNVKQSQSAPLATLTDWPPWESDGYEMMPVSSVTNAFHYAALRKMVRIAEALGKTEDAHSWAAKAERVYQAFDSVFFDSGHGLYVDGEGSRHSSLHANMFALAFGLVPAARLPQVAAFVKSRGMACSVYGAQYLFEALYRAGEGDYALSLMTAKGDRSWPHMIDVGSTITLEAWDDKYKPNEDWNHAWGAAPANLIPRLLMGVKPLEPGFARFRVCPQAGSLTRATLVLPTIRGTVRLEVDQPDPHSWRASLTVPANSRAEIDVPAADPADVTEGGRPALQSPEVKYLRRSGDRVVFAVSSGRYNFVAHR